ncbi:MAG: rRNA maturation RNase YbeY [Candidatus Omnitrophica bacterium]|nr:rRNA maturation RNase YbeY [Candidatus Omnitrophota bacterium]
MAYARPSAVEVTVKNLQDKIPLYPKRIKKAILNVLSKEGIKKSGEITVCFVDDNKIKELNKEYSGQAFPTDVLAFDYSKNTSEISADIAVSTETAIRQSKIFKTTPLYEVYLYLIHGVLHLLGYDDDTLRKQARMQKRAEAILSSILFAKNVHP